MKNQKVTVMKTKIKILPNEKQRRPSREQIRWPCSHIKQIGMQNTRYGILLLGNFYFSKSSLNTWTGLFSDSIVHRAGVSLTLVYLA